MHICKSICLAEADNTLFGGYRAGNFACLDFAPNPVPDSDVSKKRPSSASASKTAPAAARPWSDRVFHNTHTRGGRRKAVRGWAVKIQWQGKRRTFSLVGATRREAAAEAKKIHGRLRLEGWDAVSQLPGFRGGPSGQNDVQYWKGRLGMRKSGVGAELNYAARLDHEGRGAYFPLGGSGPEQAASKALQIHNFLVRKGWEKTRASFSCEVTMGFRWAANPLLWSYTTLHTLPAPSGTPRPLGNQAASRIAIVEPTRELRNALLECLSGGSGTRCAPFETPAHFEAALAGMPISLCLVNIECADSWFSGGPVQLRTLPSGVCALPYSLHVDSDDLFLSAPGGLSGYCFKRLPPAEILLPVAHLMDRPAAASALIGAIEAFFQGVTRIPAALPAPASRQPSFTRREHEVLALLSKGHVDKEIARSLGISGWTVHEHIKRIFEKLGVHSRLEATLAYLQK